MGAVSVGSIVNGGGREWGVIRSEDAELQAIGIHYRLHDLGLDQIVPASFPAPSALQAGDHISVELLFNAARLTLRDGAGPFRSLGHVSCRRSEEHTSEL